MNDDCCACMYVSTCLRGVWGITGTWSPLETCRSGLVVGRLVSATVRLFHCEIWNEWLSKSKNFKVSVQRRKTKKVSLSSIVYLIYLDEFNPTWHKSPTQLELDYEITKISNFVNNDWYEFQIRIPVWSLLSKHDVYVYYLYLIKIAV